MYRQLVSAVAGFLALVAIMPPQSRAQSGNEATIIDNIDVALAVMERSDGWSTGMACMLSWVPATSAKDLGAALEAVISSIWAYEIERRCGADVCPGPERELTRQGLDAEFNQCVSYSHLEYNLKRRRKMFSVIANR